MKKSPLPTPVVKELHQWLEQRQKDLVEILRQELLDLEEARGPLSEYEIRDTRDIYLIAALADVHVSNADRHLEEMQEINEAIARIHNGEYGVCTFCYEPIPVDRLRAYPTARRHRECQELHERMEERQGQE